jgi:hypothetical protein
MKIYGFQYLLAEMAVHAERLRSYPQFLEVPGDPGGQFGGLGVQAFQFDVDIAQGFTGMKYSLLA